MEINIKIKVDEELLKTMEKAVEEGKKIVIKIRDLSAELKFGPDSKKEVVYEVSKEGIKRVEA